MAASGRPSLLLAVARWGSSASRPPAQKCWLLLRKPRGPLTWGHEHKGSAPVTDAMVSPALEPVQRLGQWEGEAGRLPMARSLLHVDTPVLPEQAVGDGGAAHRCLGGHLSCGA